MFIARHHYSISPSALFIGLGLLFLPLHYYQEMIHPWFLDLGVDLLNSDSDKVDPSISSRIRFISKINVTPNKWVIKSGGLLRYRNTLNHNNFEIDFRQKKLPSSFPIGYNIYLRISIYNIKQFLLCTQCICRINNC